MSLYIEGKTLVDEDIKESIKSLKKQEDLVCCVEELYLISLYIFLNDLDFSKDLLSIIDRIEQKKNEFAKDLAGTILLYKIFIS